MNAIFFIAATVAIISSLFAITNRNAIHALLFLILSLLAISIIFYITGSPFIAALEVIVYAGAIMVLFIFVVMMLNVGNQQQESRWLSPGMWVMPAILAVILFATFMYALSTMKPIQREVQVIGPKEVGVSLFTTYLIAVEIAAIMLLAGIVGAYHLGRRKKTVIHRFLKKEEKKVLTKIPS